MKLIIVLLTLLFGTRLSFAQDLNIDPSSLKLKIYRFAISTSPFCTNPKVIFDSSTPEYQDILVSPTFGSGVVADGSYSCVIIEFSDRIEYAPNANSTSGNCTNGTTATLDVCEAGSGTSQLINGTTTTCTNGEDRIAMYLSTASSQTTAANFANPPTTIPDSTKGFNLGSVLEVTSTTTAKFVVNATDKICDGDDPACPGFAGTCYIDPPLFSFEKL